MYPLWLQSPYFFITPKGFHREIWGIWREMWVHTTLLLVRQHPMWMVQSSGCRQSSVGTQCSDLLNPSTPLYASLSLSLSLLPSLAPSLFMTLYLSLFFLLSLPLYLCLSLSCSFYPTLFIHASLLFLLSLSHYLSFSLSLSLPPTLSFSLSVAMKSGAQQCEQYRRGLGREEWTWWTGYICCLATLPQHSDSSKAVTCTQY